MKIHPRFQRSFALAALAVTALWNGGCASVGNGLDEAGADAGGQAGEGYVFYLDGMGGAEAAKNWSEGVQSGLEEGGFQGTGEIFTWEKGSGQKVNEDTSMAYKRKRADELTWDIEDRLEEFPGAPVELIGYGSGGTVALHALEALPESVQVENVILLGPTLADDYDLTKALRRVKGSVTVFTTADGRGTGAAAAGFIVPDGASARTREEYAEKVLIIPSSTPFETAGRIEKDFVRDQVAPFLMGGGGLIFDAFDASAYDASGFDGSALFAE